MAIANMNPNRAVVDLPVAIAELREIPELIRDTGRVLTKHRKAPSAGKAHLMAQFGWVPLISDLAALLNFTKKVAEREKYLRRLNSGFVRIKRKIGEEAGSFTENTTPWPGTVEPTPAFNTANTVFKWKRIHWASARLQLSVALSERDLRLAAFDAVLGLGGGISKQAWELLPWSWLIDWFTNTGDILGAYRSGIKFSWKALNIMSMTTWDIKMTFPSVRPTFHVSLTTPQGIATLKRRQQAVIVSTYPQFYIPYLNAGQWGILAALLHSRNERVLVAR